MVDLEKQIEEYLSKCDKVENSRLSIWMDGIKSEVAKAYHTKGMYSEEEVVNILNKLMSNYLFYGNGIFNKENPFSISEWFEQNKKK